MSKQLNIKRNVMLDSASIYLCQEKECLQLHASSSKSLNKIINTDIEMKKKFCVIIVEPHGLFVIFAMYDLKDHIFKLNDISLSFTKYHQQRLRPLKRKRCQKLIVIMTAIQAHLV